MMSSMRPEMPTAGRFPVRRKRPNRPSVDISASSPTAPESTYLSGIPVQTTGATSLSFLKLIHPLQNGKIRVMS
jgi:hypothetical protein